MWLSSADGNQPKKKQYKRWVLPQKSVQISAKTTIPGLGTAETHAG